MECDKELEDNGILLENVLFISHDVEIGSWMGDRNGSIVGY
jgi:hypothetical protein